ncbi:ATP-binding protein [Streptomyces sp. MB22_4]|uniref:ATP-binding protein n=1 Tax=Streptomyces sp. MB22_4 TaxID=3383120 RepID=UPI0039A395C4
MSRQRSTTSPTNSPFTEWDKTFGVARLCAAIADRVTFRCTLIQTGTESYGYQTTQESLFNARSWQPARQHEGLALTEGWLCA